MPRPPAAIWIGWGFSGAAMIEHLPGSAHIPPLTSSRPVEVMDPSWRTWISLVELAVAESQQPDWSAGIHLKERPPEAPLLHGATLRVSMRAASNIVRHLVRELGIVNADGVEPLSLILGGVERDPETLDELARRLAVPVDTVAVLAQLCALPLLLNAAKKLEPESSRTWQRGYCPVCGAWPAMIEMRGIQRERRLRCGCCGSDWMLPVLRCAFCDETDHNKLALLTEEGDQQLRVETCATCRGYLKTLNTLGALPFTTLASKDLTTIAFDIAARDRGYSRPARPGWPVQVEIEQ
jgi:FdhE protein